MKIKYLALVLTTIAFTLPACKSAKKVTTAVVKPTETGPLSILSIFDRMAKNEVKADWMSGDSDVNYEGKPMNVSGTLNIRFRRDSVIWVNVKKFGFNVARAKITTDSVFIVNYLQANYVAENLKYLETKYNLPADFKIIQNILLGNPIFLTDKNQLQAEKDASGDILLRGSDAKWKATYRLDAATTNIKEMIFEQPSSERTMKIMCEKYDLLKGYGQGDKNFSYLRTIQVASPQTGKINVALEVDNDGLEINIPKTIKFEIPSHYSKM